MVDFQGGYAPGGSDGSRIREMWRDPASRMWLNNVADAQRVGRQVSVVCGLDSLFAVNSPIETFRPLAQGVMGDGGVGFVAFNNTMTQKEGMLFGTGGGSERTNANFNAVTGDSSLYAPSLYYLQYTGAANLSMDLTDKLHSFTDATVIFLKQLNGGTFNWRDGAVTTGPIAVNTADAAKSLGFIKRSGWPSQKNNLVRASSIAGNVTLIGADLRNGTSGIVVHRVAQPGNKLSQVAALDGAAYTAFLQQIGCDLYILNAGMNDPPSTASAYEANMRKVLDWVRAANPRAAIRLIGMNDTDTPSKNIILQSYRDTLDGIAREYNAMVSDDRLVTGSFEQAQASLLMVDGTHTNVTGSDLRGKLLFEDLGGAALKDVRKALTS